MSVNQLRSYKELMKKKQVSEAGILLRIASTISHAYLSNMHAEAIRRLKFITAKQQKQDSSEYDSTNKVNLNKTK